MRGSFHKACNMSNNFWICALETSEDHGKIKEQIDRRVLASLFQQFYKCTPQESWWATFFSPAAEKTRLKGLSYALSILTTLTWVPRFPSGNFPAPSIELFCDLVDHILAVNSTHKAHVDSSWRPWRAKPSNYGIEGKEAGILLAYQAAYLMAAHIFEFGTPMHIQILQDPIQRLKHGGITDTWLCGLSHRSSQVDGTTSCNTVRRST